MICAPATRELQATTFAATTLAAHSFEGRTVVRSVGDDRIRRETLREGECFADTLDYVRVVKKQL